MLTKCLAQSPSKICDLDGVSEINKKHEVPFFCYIKYDPPLMLIKDADTQARWYYQLKAEYAKAVAEGRDFINPVKEQVLRWRS